MNSRNPDWDWEALFDRLTSLATVAHIVDSTPMDARTRRISLERMVRDTAEASQMAAFILAREGGEPS
ncbi:hypothetical protein OG735_26395 [Streptomyces sp. NBC_01210]|uniref:hypothetical protein n=1 Tax=Streptomyces sp. NBC_01210 TaxID=2903774 RepID=UPI002E0ED15B|nr:hypothetical protein OG735_26395 [Streptomyces sp. NBC_01210]